jgi:hypothetical protein
MPAVRAITPGISSKSLHSVPDSVSGDSVIAKRHELLRRFAVREWSFGEDPLPKTQANHYPREGTDFSGITSLPLRRSTLRLMGLRFGSKWCALVKDVSSFTSGTHSPDLWMSAIRVLRPHPSPDTSP